MITYPLALPTHTGFAQIEMRATNAVAYSRSPFTFSGQAFAYPGQMWTADITLPPMKRADAEQWVAWLISLRGQLGTFLLGDPTGVTPRGSALGGRVNLLTYSEQFDNAAWNKNLVSITNNYASAPDGTLTADRFVSAGGAFPQISQALTLTVGQPYTFSVWVKSDGTSQIAQALLLEGVVTAFTPTTTWTRVSVSIASSAGGSRSAVVATNSGVAAASSFIIWGAQVELGSTATTYQPIFNAYGPYVNGASQTGGSLVIDGASPDETGYLLAGDYIQLGTNGSSRLHKVLTNVNTDSSGNATLDIWPHIRVAPADNATVTVSSAKGLFRLSSNEQAWSVNEAAIYGITFSAMEVV